MPDSFTFNIAGWNITLQSLSGEGEYEGMGSFRLFETGAPADNTLQVSCGAFPNPLTGQLLFDSQHAWRLYRQDHKLVIIVRSGVQDPYQVGVFTTDYHSGEIYVAKSASEDGKYVFPLSYPLGQLYLTSLLSQGYGLTIHGCAIVRNGKGILFAGVSGAGKSTTARLWEDQPGIKVLNDDRVFVRKVNSGFRVYGSPWPGEGGFAIPEAAPLERIFILKHASVNHTLPLTPIQSAAELVVRSFPPLWDQSGMDFTLRFLDELCRSIPCAEFAFVPDASAIEYICGLL